MIINKELRKKMKNRAIERYGVIKKLHPSWSWFKHYDFRVINGSLRYVLWYNDMNNDTHVESERLT